MLRLDKISAAMMVSADTIESIYEDCGASPPAEARRLIADLRQLAKEAISEASDRRKDVA